MELNKIYNENCLDTMARMPDGFIDLVVTSPPYDNLRKYNGYSFDFEAIAKYLYRVIKPGGVVVWVVADATVNGSETGTSFRQALYFMECGFNLHDTMIYKKQNPTPLTHNRYEQEFEYMFVFSNGKPKSVNLITEKSVFAGTKTSGTIRHDDSDRLSKKHGHGVPILDYKIKGNVFTYAVGSEKYNGDKHPAIFPEQLAKDHIFSWSNVGDLVYDPFGGSGTTAKMAHQLQRNWVLSEISKEYCQLAEKRIKPHLSTLYLFDCG